MVDGEKTEIGKIVNVQETKSDKWVKHTYTLKSRDNKTHYLSLFISDKDNENVTLRKQGWVKDFAKGNDVEISYVEKGKYKNVTFIREVGNLAETNEKYNVVPIENKVENKVDNVDKTDKNQREWVSKCVVATGTMEEIAKKNNEINEREDAFVVATHVPTRLSNHPEDGSYNKYETLIFYKERKK